MLDDSTFELTTNIVWQARRDLNPQPPDLESDALPLELLAYFFERFTTLFG
jgi:hypothetical protein